MVITAARLSKVPNIGLTYFVDICICLNLMHLIVALYLGNFKAFTKKPPVTKLSCHD